MGYNLNCESFITKDSSVDPNEERYAPPSGKYTRKNKSKTKKKKKPKPSKIVEEEEDQSTLSDDDPPRKVKHSKKKSKQHQDESDGESSDEERVRSTPKKSKRAKSTKPNVCFVGHRLIDLATLLDGTKSPWRFNAGGCVQKSTWHFNARTMQRWTSLVPESACHPRTAHRAKPFLP